MCSYYINFRVDKKGGQAGLFKQILVLNIGTYKSIPMFQRRTELVSSLNFDRFIHPIHSNHLNLPSFSIQEPQPNNYQTHLKNVMFDTTNNSISNVHNSLQLCSGSNVLDKSSISSKQRQKLIPQLNSFKTHYVPFMIDCLNLNFLDCGYNNTIALAIKNKLFIWGSQAEQAKLFNKRDLSTTFISSVKFDKDYYLATGNTKSLICIYDMNKTQQISRINHQFHQINSIDWMGVVLASGSKNGYIAVCDVRIGKSIIKYKKHSKQICTIKWNTDGNLLASTGIDEKVVIYDIRKGQELATFAANNGPVRAIDWCPQNSNILLVGCGKNDRHLRFYSIHSLEQQYCIKTDSQILNVAFSKISNEMVSTHGHPKHDIKIWKSNNKWKNEEGVENIGVMTGHRKKVSYLAMNPDGDMIVTSSGDRTVRLWRPFHSCIERNQQLIHQQLR